MVEAGGRHLAGKPNDGQAREAFRVKLGGLDFLTQNDDPAAMAQLKAFPAELKKAGQPALAHVVDGILLQIKLQDAAQGSAEGLTKTIDEVRTFLCAKRSPPTWSWP